MQLRHSNSPARVEKALIILMFLCSLSAFQNLLVTGPIATQNMGMAGMQIFWSFLYIALCTVYLRVCPRPIKNITALTPIVAVVVFVFASTLWSQSWPLTIRRSIALALTVVFGTYFASRFSCRQQLRMLSVTFGICIIFSFGFELLKLNPNEGIAGWYGIFYLKTQLGANMVISTLVFLFWKKLEPQKMFVAVIGVSGSLALVFLSRDVTSIMSVVILLILLPFVQWAFRRSVAWAIATVSMFLCFGALCVLYIGAHLQQVTGLLGKDPQLTGRLPLWILSTAMALQRPWFGYGFNAFWLPDTIYVRRIWQILGWMPPHAHNGVLELWLELGVVGTAIFFLGFGYYVLRAVKFLRSTSDPAAAWPLIFLLLFFLANLTETSFLQANSVFFVLYVATAATVAPNTGNSIEQAPAVQSANA